MFLARSLATRCKISLYKESKLKNDRKHSRNALFERTTRWRVMPYACGDYIHDFVVITYQSFGLDKKIPRNKSEEFFV